MANTKDMTKGSPYKLIINFAFPLFLSNLFQQLYNSADSIIVGKFIGTNALAAVSTSGNLIFLFTSFFIGCSMGSTVVIGKYFGMKDYSKMEKAIHTSVIVGFISGILLSILGVIFTPKILIIMNTPKDVLPLAITYFRIYFLGVLGSILYNFLNAILQAVGNSKRGLLYLIISSVSNIILDLLFIGVFKMGVGSAALATGIAHFISAILCFLFLIKKGTLYQVDIKKLKIDKEMLKEILKTGIPSGIQNSVIGLANVVVLSNINKFDNIAQAGYGTYSKLEGFAFLPITCFNQAITTFVSQNLGAKEYDRARMGSRFGILTSMSLAELIGVLMYIFIPYLASIFTSDKNVIEYAVKQARIESLFFFLLSFSHIIASVCRGAGKAFVPMFVMLSIWCVLRVLYITFIMSKYPDEITYIYWAYPLTWSLSSVIYFIYYRYSDWIHGFDKKETLEIKN